MGFRAAQFLAKASSAGVVVVELGFVPDYVKLICFDAVDPTNPNEYQWVNPERCSLWPNTTSQAGYTAAQIAADLNAVPRTPVTIATASAILNTGSTGVLTEDTSGIIPYYGQDTIAADETTDTDGKHVNLVGTAALAGHVTAPGISIPADHQTAASPVFVLAWRNDD